MNEQKREQLSALVDDELSHEASSTIKTLLEDSEARETWARYHLIGDSLRGHLPKHIEDITDNVSKAVASEPTVFAPLKKTSNQPMRALIKPAMGFAIAASVAAVAIFNVQQAKQVPDTAPTAIAQSNISTDAPSLLSSRLASQQNEATQIDQYQSPDPRLSRYLVNYNEYRANTGVGGMPPHVRMVANEAQSNQ